MTRGIVGAVALLAGFAVMALELTAVRLLAPHFGDSAYVWTNVIGVMLVALAGGAWLGGRLADPASAGARLSTLFVLGAAWTATVPLWANALGAWLLPQDLPLDSAMPALVRGSLAATLLLFAPAVTLVGCVTPILVAALAARDGRVGPASGLVAGWSTLGSLAGTFAATHLLVPGVGSRGTIWLCAALLGACALVVRPGLRGAVATVVPVVFLPFDWGVMRAPVDGEELLAEVESGYQYLQVVRSDEGGTTTTKLKINEGLDSFHSVTRADSSFTGGLYYDYHVLAALLAGDGTAPANMRVLSLGAAAGTFSRLFQAAFPSCSVDGVEIDPAVIALGEQHFGGFGPDGRTFEMDARVFVERSPSSYDVVLVDAYERQIYVPAHVASRQFFEAVRRCLIEGGVVAVNSGGRNFDDPVVQALAETMAAVFGEAQAFRVPQSRNFTIFARRDRPIDLAVLVPEAQNDSEVRRVVEDAGYAASWRRVTPGANVLDDDQPLLDQLQESALEREFGEAGVVPMAGPDAPDVAAERARAALTEQHDYRAALAAVQAASEPTAYLRALAGDARWYLHDVRGALQEYEAGERLADGEMLAFVQAKSASARELLAGADRSQSIATRNSMLALGALVVCAGGVAFAGLRAR